MRYSLLIAALAAGCVNATTKVVTVTDWTTTTVTETVTASPVTETVGAFKQAEVVKETSTETVTAAQTATSELAKKSTVLVPEAQPTALEREEVNAETFYWTSAWTSAWTSTYEPAPITAAAETTTAAPVVVETHSTLATSTSAAAAATATSAYQQKALYNHNVHRSNHTVSSLDWSADLESSAQTLAAKCVYEHDTSIDGGGYGQNIGYGKTASQVGEMITNMMYNGEIGYYPGYGASDPSMTNFDAWGHFSQIVWKATTHVGCATVLCNSLGNVDSSEAVPFTVCNYSPAGNVDTEYGANVLQPTGAATYTSS
ncbi:hypothetical protein N7495_002661 [Penicillium taxi]|uniref:uncharacterized protein n=1 Tax=Penicillium taxi TaxID=168475 RepID=UPI002545A762|nr:uncharacterized protein N7495_002661 [Penicillium taxi]KAJ5902133.1 hypothetical protein N7495_002661 [Penicillium taxi]